MIIETLQSYKNGWLVGAFYPSLMFRKDIEVGIHHLSKGEKGDGHYHKEAAEINVIISGKVELAPGFFLGAGAMWTYEPYEKSLVSFVEDTTLLIIRTASVPNDKFYDNSPGSIPTGNSSDNSNIPVNPVD
jgi:hypothetical protein